MDTIMHQPQACCCQELAAEIRELRAQWDALRACSAVADAIIRNSRRTAAAPSRRPRRTGQLVPFPAGRAAS